MALRRRSKSPVSTAQTTSVHPETTRDPASMRWIVSHQPLPFAGELISAPGLDELLGHQIATVMVGPDSVLITLAEGNDWRSSGGQVRSALVTALARTSDWVGGPDSRELSRDDILRICAQELVDGPIGDIATAHGGSIELVEARDGVVSVKMHGACKGCPAAVITMHQRLETWLRRRVPWLAEVREVH